MKDQPNGYYLKAELQECLLCHHTVPMRPYVHNGKTLRPTICIECSYLWDIANCELPAMRQRLASEFADYDGYKTAAQIIEQAFAKHPDLAGAKLDRLAKITRNKRLGTSNEEKTNVVKRRDPLSDP